MRRLSQGEDDKFFAGYGANVVVQAQHFGAGDLLDLSGIRGRRVILAKTAETTAAFRGAVPIHSML